MRYYDLEITGKVKGSYAVPQPDKTLHLLEDAPDDESKRDGTPGDNWIPDQDIIDARLVKEAIAQATLDAKVAMKNMPGWADWTAAEAESWINTNVTDLASAKTALKAMAKAIVYLRDHSQITRSTI